MTSIKEIYERNRPKNGYNTLLNYTSILKNVCKTLQIPISPQSVVDNYKAIIKYACQFKNPQKSKNLLSPFIAYIDAPDKPDELNIIIDNMRGELRRFRKQIAEEHIDGELTERQEEGWVEMDEVKRLYEELEKKVAPYFTDNNMCLSLQEFLSCQTYVLLSCLILIPPRRSLDYASFKIRNINPDEDNYMEIDGRDACFVFNKYKTCKTYGQQEVEIPRKLRRIINTWISINPSDWLLCSRNKGGTQVHKSRINGILNNFFAKPTSTTLLRNSYITDKTSKNELNRYSDMEKLAKDMAHSVPMQQHTYLKNINKTNKNDNNHRIPV